MLKHLDDTLNKSCLIGLSYFNFDGELVKQSLLAGVVKTADQENGITIALTQKSDGSSADFMLPSDLRCWFEAPPGEYHTSQEGVKLINPDFLVTWDIYQSKKIEGDREQQWWEWVPRTEAPQVGAPSK